MNKKKLCLLLLAVLFTSGLKAQNLFITGCVFCDDSFKVEAVPFATVKYFNYKDPKKLEYIDFTDLSGQYNLGENVAQADYHIEIEAPGYEKRTKDIGNLPESFEGNLTFHIRMHRDNSSMPVPVSFTTDKLAGANNLIDAIKLLPAVDKIEENDVVSKDGSTIRVLINGFTLPADKLGQLSLFPLAALKTADYYDLKKYNTIYDGVINLVLVEGDMAGAPNFEPAETDYYDIKK
ncbi:MAG: hypothetical protein ACOYJG_09845 [Prevotella sp.]|jgi:hypothetical protein